MAGRTQLKQRAVKAGPQRVHQRTKDSCEQGLRNHGIYHSLSWTLPLVGNGAAADMVTVSEYTSSFSLEALTSSL